ncbi:MAG: thioesterase family protein [Ignavibacteriaceae bacterium]
MFTIKRKVNFFNCDPAGIMFYGNIFYFCHSAYENLISSFDLDFDYWNNDDFFVPIVHSSADYLKPLKYEDDVVIEINVTQLKESSFELSYNCKNQLGELCANVKTVHVFINKETWKKKKMDITINEGLKSHKTQN